MPRRALASGPACSPSEASSCSSGSRSASSSPARPRSSQAAPGSPASTSAASARRRAAAAREALARLERVPVTFVAGGERFTVTPKALGVEVDWAAAVATAERQGGGFGLVRGYRRLELEVFPEDLEPPVRAYNAALTYELGLIAKAIDAPHREAQARPPRAAHLDRRGRDRPRARPQGRAADGRPRAGVVHACARRAAGARRRAERHGRLARPRSAARLADRRARRSSRRADAPAHPALAARQDPRAPDDRDTPISLTGPAADAYFGRLENAGQPRAEGRRLRRQRRRERSRRARTPGRRARRAALGGAHPRRGRASDRTRRRRSRSSRRSRS